MPTSNDEAKKIVEIINEFVTVDTARKIATRLYEEVGKHTDNESLAVSLKMLQALYGAHYDET